MPNGISRNDQTGIMNPIAAVIQIGTAGKSEIEARRIRLVNLLAIIAVLTSATYLLFYIWIEEFVPILINSMTTVLYAGTFFLNRKRKYWPAKIWIFSVYMFHLLILTMFIFTRDTGFHFYAFSIPALVFLVFEPQNYRDKILFSFAAFSLFVICEFVSVGQPLIVLSAYINQLLYVTSILTVFIALLLITIVFTRSIHTHEMEQGKLILELKKALSEVKTLQGFIPICASCKKIRDDKGYWNQIEEYIRERSEAEFSHSICPECSSRLYPELDFPDEEHDREGDS